MEHKFNKEDHVLVTLTNGVSYEADVKDFSETYQKLSLTNIIQYPGNIVIDGLRHFETSEISQLKVVQKSDPPASFTTGETISNKDNEETFVRRKISDADYNKILDLQSSSCFIDSVTLQYHNSISMLQESKVLGLCGKDTSKGRCGRASVIALSTRNNIFIYDLEKLGDRVFDDGLREVLQSEAITKVVYDGRLFSDCLFHKHQIKLASVRDVEAEDVMIVHQERGYIRKHNRPLSYLIQIYLGIQNEILTETDLPETWKKRPLNPEYLKFLTAYASFLIPLHEAIERHFLQRLIKASKIYNEFMRDSDMYVYVTNDYRFVLRDKLNELVKRDNSCRGIKGKTT